MKSDSLLKTGFIFKTIDSQGDMIPFTRINTTHAPTFSYTNEKIRAQRNSNVYSTASNHDLKEEKISIPSPVAKKRLDQMFSEGGRSTASTVSNVSNKLEKAIYSLPKNKAFSIFKGLSRVLIVVNIALLVILSIITKTNLTSVKENISVISTSNLRLFQITELNRRVRGISLYENGLIDDQRYLTMGITGPLLAVIMPCISLIEVDLNNYNNIVRQAIEQIDTGLQKRLFAKYIQIVNPNTTEDKSYRNVFDATASLVVQAKQFSEIPYDQISQENSQMNYILNNTLNEQLIVGEEIIDVLLNDSEIKLQDLENLSIYFIITTCLLGIIMTIFFNFHQFKFLKSRNRFIKIFLRLNKNEIGKNMKNVRALKTALTSNGRDFKDIELKESHSNQDAKDSQTAKSFVKRSTRARSANKSGINCSLFIVQALALCIFILTIVPFLSTLLLLKSQTHLINKFVNYIVGVNRNLFETNLLGAAMGEYIQLNGTTMLLDQPIGDEFETILASLYASQSVFTDLLNSETDLMKPEYKAEHDQLDLLLSGNLCIALELPEIDCAFAQGILEKGIIGMSSFILSTFRLMKDTYDISDKSFVSAKNTLALPESIDLDIIFTLTQLPAYQKVGAILETHVDGQIDDTNNDVKLIIIVSVVVGMVLGYVLTKWLWRIVETERVNWKKLMRKIPFSIAVSDKAFKNYLVRQSDRLLDSVKDSI